MYIAGMKMPAIFLLLLAPIFGVHAQIKGRVVTATMGSAVPGSSVFISNSSIGTTADKDGYFELSRVPAGKNELVVSSVGYETSVYSFSAEQLPLQLRIELTLKVRELANVTVEPSVEEGWNKWGAMFTSNFVGLTPNARSCKIKNEDAIRFRYFKNSNRVIAYSDEPIILENKALGYRIKYQLEEFEVNFKTQTSLFSGFPFFEEMEDGKEIRKKWKRSRDKAYFGSMMHFMWCLYHDSLSQHGFEVRRMVRMPNTEKQRVMKIYRDLHNSKKPGGARAGLAALPKDSLQYYERISRQREVIDIYAKEILNSDSLVARQENAYKIMYFPDYLFVTYKNESEHPDYILFHHESRSPGYQRSYLTLQNNHEIIIDMNGGYYPPQEIITSAYWGWSEKMADCLPIDYRPFDD
jgi:hypothetical protein